MNKHSMVCATLVGLAGIFAGPGHAQQETKQEAKSAAGVAAVSPVTQEQLNAAD